MVWILKSNTKDEITVKVQRMFPNCGKYKKCCIDSGYEETMKKAKKVGMDKLVKDMLEKIKEKQV